MLIRIVRMTFEENKVEDFLKVFDENKSKIRAFPGCHHLELHRDYDQENVFGTYSLWADDTALNNYRHSELFSEVWSGTKLLFAARPVAFSHQSVETVV